MNYNEKRGIRNGNDGITKLGSFLDKVYSRYKFR